MTEAPDPPRLVEIVWEDAHGGWDSTWVKKDAIEHFPRVVHSVGYLIQSDDAGFTLAQSLDELADTVDNTLFVPRSSVSKFHFARLILQPEGQT